MSGNLAKVYSLFTTQERWQALGLGLMIVVGAIFEVVGVGAIFPVVSILSDPQQIATAPIISDLYFALGRPANGRFVAIVLFGLVLIYVCKNVYLACLAYWQGRFAYNKQAALSQRLFAHYLAQPYTFHLQRNTADLTRNLTSLVDNLISAVVLPMLMLLAEALTALALVTLLLFNNLLAGGLVMSAFCIASLLFYRAIQARLLRWGGAKQYHDGQALLHLFQGLGAVKDTIVLGRQDFFKKRYEQHSNQRAFYTGRQSFVGALPLLWLETLAVMALLGLVATLLLQGLSFALVIPTLGLFTAAAFRLMPSVNRILVSLQNLRFCTPVINTLYQEFNEHHGADVATVKQAPAGKAPLPFERAIELVNVSFTYPQATKPSLNGLSLRIGKGESVGIIGSSGAGKTTLVDIILGLLAPSQGMLTIDDVDVAGNLSGWQAKIGYVPQEIYLTDDSLRNNIAFGLPEEVISDERIWQALEIAQLAEYVRSLPDGLTTVLGERGARLSGGQRQRIGIARAVYHDPEVLVFDEATSALDNETEAAVVAAIEQLRGQKTMIVVAHRLSTVANCDRMVRLAHGQVAAEQ